MTQVSIVNNFAEMNQLAMAIARSGLFGMTKPDEALSLMAIAHAEGYSPALAARDYNIIKGRPTLKADAMLARFQQSGGKVKWHSYTDDLVCGTFSHPQGGEVTVDWDIARAKRAQLTSNPTWQKYPRNMLRARVISEAIRTVFPGVGAVGLYTPEEMEDLDIPPVQLNNKTLSNKDNLLDIPCPPVSQADNILMRITGEDKLKDTMRTINLEYQLSDVKLHEIYQKLKPENLTNGHIAVRVRECFEQEKK